MANGILFIISAPSGAGKSTLIQYILNNKLLLDIVISISYTTRKIRPGEYHGKHYYFISKEKFEYMINKKYFLEYAKVFNNYYGTSYKVINSFLSKGLDVFLDIDWQGAKQIRNKVQFYKSIFILPPSIQELYVRLKNRGQDSYCVINHRMKQAVHEIQHYLEYDYLIINDNFHSSVLNLVSIVNATRLSCCYQKKKYNHIITELLKKTY
ncbi:Guanylate kinase [Buchnera aphidicola (Pterocallis alni)]|uniref:guanylate kinase n=1 Tax=Buchnera aphidicola TaxID=9 RepID=UPI0034649C44